MVRARLAPGQRATRTQGGATYPVRCAAMSATAQVTRFAPSPTGALHLGNARTALFSWLAARASGGRFVLRVEDTDAERSQDALLERQLEELRWLGLDWDEGPDVGGSHAPYRQSERGAVYGSAMSTLAERRLTYPCFCSPEELQLSRRAQLAAGRPPRYARTCAQLSQAEVQRRVDAGQRPAIRFRVPDGRLVEFDDRVHGRQRFLSDDIGDFVIQRADGSAAFFLSNAIDDSTMGINLVLRGDDHLANTPRQLLLLEALGLPWPEYGHLPLVLAPDGRPLSKRDGAASLTELREQGYLPGAICNYLVRLGHACRQEGWVEPRDIPAQFDLSHTSRSAAHFDDTQLRHWQREALIHARDADIETWLGSKLEPIATGPQRHAFVAAVRGNVLFPADVEPWVVIVASDALPLSDAADARIREAGRSFFASARELLSAHADDFKGWTRALAAATGRKGASLFMPLRSALTGATHGPELAPLVALMGERRARERLMHAESLAVSR
jgi:glutamyl-tRNA synthetase